MFSSEYGSKDLQDVEENCTAPRADARTPRFSSFPSLTPEEPHPRFGSDQNPDRSLSPVPSSSRLSTSELVLPTSTSPAPQTLWLPPVLRQTGPVHTSTGSVLPSKLVPQSSIRAARSLLLLAYRLSAATQRVVRHRVRKATRNSGSCLARRSPVPRILPLHCVACWVKCTGRIQFSDYLRSCRHHVRTNQEK